MHSQQAQLRIQLHAAQMRSWMTDSRTPVPRAAHANVDPTQALQRPPRHRVSKFEHLPEYTETARHPRGPRSRCLPRVVAHADPVVLDGRRRS